MLGYTKKQVSLTRNQKEAIGLLSIGTFLEYFDLMLYVHMALLLNDLFFPEADSRAATLYSAIAFCSTYVFRPIGALIFGRIGDTIGRKATVIITTFLMSLCCLIMANLKTYAEIGITATIVITVCRIAQGMSSMGEVIGAELYLTEMFKVPQRYWVVASLTVFVTLGSTVALGIGTLVTSFGFDWRIAFWFGAAIAVVGAVARTNLRETPDFVNAKKRIKETVERAGIDSDRLKSSPIWKEKINKTTALALFFVECGAPLWFYIGYIYCGNMLKTFFDYDAAKIIQQNFIICGIDLIGTIIIVYLASKMHPLKILKVRLIIFSFVALASPILLNSISNATELFLFQLFIIVFAPTTCPAGGVFYTRFPVLKRFTCSSFIFALSRALMFAISSFGTIYLIDYFNHWGLLFFIVPILAGYTFGVRHFKKLEMESESYH
ncbi:MFS transporter [Rickettsia bellii]|uniref:Sugar (And other) transporter family protein n=1 Tax=Rickettsia bellii str. RML Mogi TaxID=1359194 RepID=A0A0F3QGK9_RICBE|nr:MFS transporter [Rickettsia bellii]KJV91673.1 sugar (and other) transporter family protein [Rickettsia bellii str. RML Mogi]